MKTVPSQRELICQDNSPVNRFVSWLKFAGLLLFVKAQLLQLVVSKMKAKLPDQLAWKLYEKMSVNVEVFSCTESDQSPFLISVLTELNKQDNSSADGQVEEQSK